MPGEAKLMDISGIDRNSNLNITNKKKKQEKIEKKKKEVKDLNIQSSKVDINSFDEAKDVVGKIKENISKMGTGLIDSSRINGDKIWDLLKD